MAPPGNEQMQSLFGNPQAGAGEEEQLPQPLPDPRIYYRTRHLRPDAERSRRHPELPVKNDITDTEWQMLVVGYPTNKALCHLARASPNCMKRWRKQSPLEVFDFVKTKVRYPIEAVKTIEDEKELAEHVRKWAREEACRHWVPVRTEPNPMGRVIEYREIRIDSPFDWTLVWNGKEGKVGKEPWFEHPKV
ncbi:hypothetical protein FALBO_6005 [Fusarium albosuccineum]|uniref:Uncharacterized protein n=1 Tax=Fusarium albosuccineum TaxID=1237068 RepID=A0A8H4LCI1_9HYPO|nr:hypothetical protein FALBO_6005 [Fusarium albosuccineum]